MVHIVISQQGKAGVNMNDVMIEMGSLVANCILIFLFFKVAWPFISRYITMIDSALVMLLLGFLIKDKVFKGKLHPVFIILIFAGIFVGCMWLFHTKVGFILSALFMSYLWTDLIVGEISRHWESYDLIWGIFLGVCTFLIILYFHWKDYSATATT